MCFRKIVNIFLRHNVKDNKKSVIFAPFDEKNIIEQVTVEKYLLL